MSDLVAFLLARIDEDEKAAGDISGAGRWATNGYAVTGVPPFDGAIRADTQDPRLAQHMARWDPARVLAECTAKRRIVERYQVAAKRLGRRQGDRAVEGIRANESRAVLKLLALPYAEHDDYDTAWNPEATP